MRNFITLLAAATLIVACADDPHPTAPALRSSARSANGTVGPAAQSAPSGQAKPVDQVGFTKITTVSASSGWVPAGSSGDATANCPDGTTVISGGFITSGGPISATPPSLAISRIEGNGWHVKFVNGAPGSIALFFDVFAYCAS